MFWMVLDRVGQFSCCIGQGVRYFLNGGCLILHGLMSESLGSHVPRSERSALPRLTWLKDADGPVGMHIDVGKVKMKCIKTGQAAIY